MSHSKLLTFFHTSHTAFWHPLKTHTTELYVWMTRLSKMYRMALISLELLICCVGSTGSTGSKFDFTRCRVTCLQNYRAHQADIYTLIHFTVTLIKPVCYDVGTRVSRGTTCLPVFLKSLSHILVLSTSTQSDQV